jgi:hypothetical protein
VRCRLCARRGTTAAPDIASCDGLHHHNSKAHTLEWQIDLIDSSNPSGTLEFNIAGRDTGVFFPVQVQFKSSDTLCDLDVRFGTAVRAQRLRVGRRVILMVPLWLLLSVLSVCRWPKCCQRRTTPRSVAASRAE